MTSLHSREKMEDGSENGHFSNMDMEPQSSRSGCLSRFARFLKDNLFLVSNVVGIVMGFLVGLWVRSASPGEDAIMWLGMPGELYMRILKCVILPLIVCSVIDGTGNTDPKTNGKLTLVALLYILISNTVGAILGLIASAIIKPGEMAHTEMVDTGVDTHNLRAIDMFADFIRNVFPPNVIGAALQVSQTKYKLEDMVTAVNISGQLVNRTSTVMARSLGTVNSTNILGLIVISAALGVAASQSGKHAKPFLAFFKAGAFIIFKLFTWIKWTTPLGSASLIAASLARIDNLGSAFKSMGALSLVVVGGNILLLQGIYMSAAFFAITRQNPVVFFVRAARAWLIAFGSQNSAIPYPEFVRVAELYNVNPRVTEYVLPFSVTLNRIGSAYFMTATCVFVSQYTGVPLGTGRLFTICILGILSSLAVPAVNSSSVVSIVIILESMGVSTSSGIGLVLAMEWLNDRFRTTTNAVNHAMCAVITWRLCKKGFQAVPTEDPEDKISVC